MTQNYYTPAIVTSVLLSKCPFFYFLLPPQTFCSELEDKYCTVPSLRHVSMRLYICHSFTLTLRLESLIMECVLQCLGPWGKGGKNVDVLWRPCTLQTFTRSSLFSLTLRERQSTEDSPQDYSGHRDALCVFAHTWKRMSFRNSQGLTSSILGEVSHKAQKMLIAKVTGVLCMKCIK